MLKVTSVNRAPMSPVTMTLLPIITRLELTIACLTDLLIRMSCETMRVSGWPARE